MSDRDQLMTVDVWARQEAEKKIASREISIYEPSVMKVFPAGVVHAFDALLSDKALRAMGKESARHAQAPGLGIPKRISCYCGKRFPSTAEGCIEFHDHGPRAALQAAIAAVTEGDTE